MYPSRRIVLVGPMGAGKTTIGRLLAKQLSLPFKDSDSVIEERAGADIPWIFDVEGESGFRKRETAVLEDLLKEPSILLATGGGIVTQDSNRELLSEADEVIYLAAAPEHLIKRLQKDKKRPLLQVDDPAEKIRELYKVRDPLYRQVATRIVVTDTRSPRLVAKEIAKLID